jgi:electron transfer flavoprotein beta subunit
VLTGSISGDNGSGHVGGMLAAMLGIRQVALATGLSVAGSTATVKHEVEGGLERVVELDLPALVTVQTGINEPRYVSIRGIRKVSGMEIPVLSVSDLGLDPAAVGRQGARVVTEELFLPPRGEGAEILEGDDEEMVDALIERLREHGGL